MAPRRLRDYRPAPMSDLHAGPGSPPVDEVGQLADACVRFVERATSVRLDFTPDTLSVLDHYVTEARGAKERPEALEVVARAVAAYFGEVVRRRFDAWWAPLGDDVATFQIRFRPVFLAIQPYALACAALGMVEPGEDNDIGLVIDEEEIDDIAQHLALLPPVTEEEFTLPTTRYEVIEIVVDQLKARANARGLGDVIFEDPDYDE